MNNKDLQSFITAFEELYYEGRKVYENHRAEARRIQEQEIEKEASRLEITVDYYLAEFV